MTRAAGLALAAVVLVPASAGAGTSRPPLALTATPAHIALAGSDRATIRVTNPGTSRVDIDVTRAGFALDLRGRPRIVARNASRAAVSWLAVRPGRLLLPPGASRSVVVTSRLPARVEPGDHDALVLLTTRPRRRAALGVQMRIGVVVVVRAPGKVVRRLAMRGMRVRRTRGTRFIEVLVVNQGNTTESLGPSVMTIALRRGEARATLRASPRELRPQTSGVAEVPYRGRLAGWAVATVRIAGSPGRPPVTRTFRIRL